MDYTLTNLADMQDDAGSYANVHFVNDVAIGAASSIEEFHFLIESLESEGLILDAGLDTENVRNRMRLTQRGWARIRALRETPVASSVAFVAMSFAPDMEDVYLEAIRPAVIAAGYDPRRVDKTEHNDRIDDRIVALLREARFVIAEFTHNSRGVYFEAGFGVGAGLDVIWLCRDTAEDRASLHFNTNHYNHIFWKSPTALATALTQRIAATVGWGPKREASLWKP